MSDYATYENTNIIILSTKPKALKIINYSTIALIILYEQVCGSVRHNFIFDHFFYQKREVFYTYVYL